LDVVVVNHIDQVVGIVDVLKIISRLRIFLVDDSPSVQPDAESLFLPDLEGLIVYDCWLNDFFVAEHSPSNSVYVIILDILEFISSCIEGLVTDHVVFF
jgi:hypothetical protein